MLPNLSSKVKISLTGDFQLEDRIYYAYRRRRV